MSASVDTSAIFMSDTPKKVKDKINKYAFSGGQVTVELHRQLGGDPEVDVAYQYLSFFLDDDEELASLSTQYKDGTLLTGELKKRCIDVLNELVLDFQSRKSQVTLETVLEFMDSSKPMPWAVNKGLVSSECVISGMELLTINDAKESKGSKKKPKKE
jgi:tryptophanyl-tRNA synthetase